MEKFLVFHPSCREFAWSTHEEKVTFLLFLDTKIPIKSSDVTSKHPERFSVDKKIWTIKIGICASFAVINWNFRFQLFACKCSPFFVASILFSPLGRGDKAPKGKPQTDQANSKKANFTQRHDMQIIFFFFFWKNEQYLQHFFLHWQPEILTSVPILQKSRLPKSKFGFHNLSSGSDRPNKISRKSLLHSDMTCKSFCLKRWAVFATHFFALANPNFDLGSNFTKAPTSQIQIWFP